MRGMTKLTKDYFTNNEVLIVGFPLNGDASMKMILPAFLRNNISVLALNGDYKGEDVGIKVYKSFEELPKVPECAYIYLARENITPWIDQMAKAGIKRVLFHSKKDVDPSDVERTQKAGMETAIACPMMLLGKGIHRLHKFLAGV